MTYALLIAFVIFSMATGFTLAGNHVNVWGMICYAVIGLITIQVGYFLALLAEK